MRTLIGLALGIALLLLGVPVLQSVVARTGFFHPFTFQDAILSLLLILATVIAVQLTALRPPPSRKE